MLMRLPILRCTTPFRDVEAIKRDAFDRDVIDGYGLVREDSYAKLLCEFADKGLLRRFSKLAMATGNVPDTRIE